MSTKNTKASVGIDATASLPVERMLSHLQRNDILLPSPQDIRDYLLRYPDMVELVLPVCRMAQDEFGMDAQFALEVYHSRETDEEHLSLYIRQEHYSEDILDRIEKISSGLERDLADRSGWFLVTTDFRVPKEDTVVV